MLLAVKILPRSKETAFAGHLADGTLKIHIKAAPEKGRANKELVAFLAKALKIQKSEIHIVRGHMNTKKLLEIPLACHLSTILNGGSMLK